MMNKKKLKILVSLFALNSITLYLYFSSHPDHFRHKKSPQNHSPITQNRFSSSENHFYSSENRQNSKPWPILPSYLPWSQNPNTRYRSCEGYFGNGFSKKIDLLKNSPALHRSFAGASPELRRRLGGGWFRCYFSETLQSSICEGGAVKMNSERISMSRGGEKLDAVIGRGEDEELPVFKEGAFEILVNDRRKIGKKLSDEEFLSKYLPEGAISRHTMRELVDSIRLVGADEFHCNEILVNDRKKIGGKLGDEEFLNKYLPEGAISRHTMRELVDLIRLVGVDEFHCSEWIEEPSLLITRFEYANLFHTVTDWYSAYAASRVTGLPSRPHLVFVDGHCETQLEETWRALFSSLTYAKNFSGPVCFRHAILSPLGYETALFKGLTEHIDCSGASAHDLWQNPDDKKTARLSEFGEMIRAAFGFPVDRQNIPRTATGPNVLFVRREDYLAHPRHGGKVQSRLSNEQQVFDSIKSWAGNHTGCKLNVINGLFAHMSMKEQVRAIQDASVIVGAHGAGLTHIVSAAPKAVILEIISSEYRRPHFALIAQWKGLEYHPIYLQGGHADPPVVIDELSSILKSLGC